jgi:hypothetical protein
MRYMTMWGLIALVALPAAVSAQGYATDQGSYVLGGTASFTSQGGDLHENLDGDRLNTLSLNPYVLYFITPGLGIGGELGVARATQGDDDLTTIGVGPTIAYYFGDAASQVRPFIEAHAGYESLSSDFFDASGWMVGGGGGAAIMLTPTVALTLSGVYEIQNVSVDGGGDVDGDEFRFEAGVAAFIF